MRRLALNYQILSTDLRRESAKYLFWNSNDRDTLHGLSLFVNSHIAKVKFAM